MNRLEKLREMRGQVVMAMAKLKVMADELAKFGARREGHASLSDGETLLAVSTATLTLVMEVLELMIDDSP